MKPSLTLGCGSWGGNSVSENVGVKHLINVKTVAERRENMLWFRAPERSTSRRFHARRPRRAGQRHGQEARLHRHRPVPLQEWQHPRHRGQARRDGHCPTTASTTSSPIRRCSAHVAAPSRWLSLSRTHHRRRRWLRYGRRQDHVDDVRAPRVQVRGHGHGLHGHPQAHLHLPRDGQEGLLRRVPTSSVPAPSARRSPSSPTRRPASSGRSPTTRCSPTWLSSTPTTA